MGSYQLVSERQGEHIKVSQSDHQVSPLCSSAHELRNLPCLSGTVTKIRVVGLPFIRCMEMSAENFGNITFTSANSDLGTSNTFPNIPIPSEECCGPPVQGVSDHIRFNDRPFREYGQTATKDAAVVEFAIRKDVFGLSADTMVVFLGPTLLETDDFGNGADDG